MLEYGISSRKLLLLPFLTGVEVQKFFDLFLTGEWNCASAGMSLSSLGVEVFILDDENDSDPEMS